MIPSQLQTFTFVGDLYFCVLELRFQVKQLRTPPLQASLRQICRHILPTSEDCCRGAEEFGTQDWRVTQPPVAKVTEGCVTRGLSTIPRALNKASRARGTLPWPVKSAVSTRYIPLRPSRVFTIPESPGILRKPGIMETDFVMLFEIVPRSLGSMPLRRKKISGRPTERYKPRGC
eukprot:609918-Amorphochlora_amoeboformis.AAC.1